MNVIQVWLRTLLSPLSAIYIYIATSFDSRNLQKCHVRKKGIKRLNVSPCELESDSPYEYLSPPNTDDALNESTEGEGGEEQRSDDADPENPTMWDTDNEGDMWGSILTYN